MTDWLRELYWAIRDLRRRSRTGTRVYRAAVRRGKRK